MILLEADGKEKTLEHPGTWAMKYTGCHHFQLPRYTLSISGGFSLTIFLGGNVPGFIRRPRIA